MNIFLAQCVNSIHSILTFIVFMSWYFLSIDDLRHYTVFMLFILLHWYFLNGKCLLTVLEYKLLNKEIVDIGYEHSPFLKQLFLNMGINIEEKIIASFTYISIIVLILLALFRLNFTK